MKKTTITIGVDEEKLAALKIYLEQKGQTVEGELEKALEAMYGKTVPNGVREYLDMRAGNSVPAQIRARRLKSSPSSVVGAPHEDAANG